MESKTSSIHLKRWFGSQIWQRGV